MEILMLALVLAGFAVLGVLYFRFCVKFTEGLSGPRNNDKKNSGEGGETWPEIEYEDSSLEHFEEGTYEDASTGKNSLFRCGIGFCWRI
jgi:hypothetical protein